MDEFQNNYAQCKKSVKHERSAQAWCTGKTQREQVERGAGGGDRDGEYM